MNQRIVIVCQGKSKGFTVNDNFKNISLTRNVKKVSSVLEEKGNWIPEHYKLQDIDALRSFFKTIHKKYSPSQIIFYYTGHGHVENDIYYIVGETDTRVNLQEALYDLKIYDSVSVIVDACRSGYLVRKWDNNYPYLFLTASDTNFAYHLDDKDMSYFSYMLEKSIRNGRKLLSEIQYDLEEDYDNLPYEKQQKSRQVSLCTEICIANEIDIKTEQPSSNQELFFTIDLTPIDSENYNFTILVKWEKNDGETIIQNITPYDERAPQGLKAYAPTEITTFIDNYIFKNYPQISPHKIVLSFILPSELMSKGVSLWEIEDSNSNQNQLLGSKYTVLLRGRERIFTEGENKDNQHYNIETWKENWEQYELKVLESLSVVKCPIQNLNLEQRIPSGKAYTNPFALMYYNPTPESFKILYKLGFPLIMWANGCNDFNDFKNLFENENYRDMQFGCLHKNLDMFTPIDTELDANAHIMLIYDNPKDIPVNLLAKKRLTSPQIMKKDKKWKRKTQTGTNSQEKVKKVVLRGDFLMLRRGEKSLKRKKVPINLIKKVKS